MKRALRNLSRSIEETEKVNEKVDFKKEAEDDIDSDKVYVESVGQFGEYCHVSSIKFASTDMGSLSTYLGLL